MIASGCKGSLDRVLVRQADYSTLRNITFSIFLNRTSGASSKHPLSTAKKSVHEKAIRATEYDASLLARYLTAHSIQSDLEDPAKRETKNVRKLQFPVPFGGSLKPRATLCPITLTSITHLRNLVSAVRICEKQSKASPSLRQASLIYFKIAGIPRIKAGRYNLATILRHLCPPPPFCLLPFFLCSILFLLSSGPALISHLIGSDLINFTENAIKRPLVAPNPPFPHRDTAIHPFLRRTANPLDDPSNLSIQMRGPTPASTSYSFLQSSSCVSLSC